MLWIYIHIINFEYSIIVYQQIWVKSIDNAYIEKNYPYYGLIFAPPPQGKLYSKNKGLNAPPPPIKTSFFLKASLNVIELISDLLPFHTSEVQGDPLNMAVCFWYQIYIYRVLPKNPSFIHAFFFIKFLELDIFIILYRFHVKCRSIY